MRIFFYKKKCTINSSICRMCIMINSYVKDINKHIRRKHMNVRVEVNGLDTSKLPKLNQKALPRRIPSHLPLINNSYHSISKIRIFSLSFCPSNKS